MTPAAKRRERRRSAKQKRGRVSRPSYKEGGGAEAMRTPLWPDKQMLYLAPMAKNCRFPAAAIVSVTAARGPRAREDKLPIQVRASSEEGKRGRRRNPIPLLSFPPFLFSLSCPHNVTSTFSLHSHVRNPPALRLPGGRSEGDGPHIATPLLTTSSDLPREGERKRVP